MKRAGLWAIGIGMLFMVGILTVEQGYPGPRKCSVATLKGTYLVSGILYMVDPGAPPPAPPAPTVEAYIAVAARTIYDGEGMNTNFARFTINGAGNGKSPFIDSTSEGSYTVDADCKGTETHIDPNTGFHHQYVTIISPDGNEVHIVAIDPGVVQALVARRVERIGRDDR